MIRYRIISVLLHRLHNKIYLKEIDCEVLERHGEMHG